MPLREATTFRKSIGGTSTNVAVAAARLGVHAATVTKVGDDAMGEYVRHALADTFGVDTRWVGVDPTLADAARVRGARPRERPVRVLLPRAARAGSGPHRRRRRPRRGARRRPCSGSPASCVAWEPSRSTIHAVLAARGRRAHTVLDLDWRPMFWPSADEAAAHVAPLLDHVTIAIGNRAECEIAVGTTDPDEAADRLLARGLDAAIVKLGGDGVLVAPADGSRERIAPYEIDLVCGLGAGDAFGGALCHGLVNGLGLAEGARRGNAAGAIVAGRMMCADDMPTPQDIDALLQLQGAGGTTIIMTRPRLGIGVVGFGWMGQAHSRSAARIASLFPERTFDTELVICGDNVPSRQEQAVDGFGFREATPDWQVGRRPPRRRRRLRHRAEHDARGGRGRRRRRPARPCSARSRSAASPTRRCASRPRPARPA